VEEKEGKQWVCEAMKRNEEDERDVGSFEADKCNNLSCGEIEKLSIGLVRSGMIWIWNFLAPLVVSIQV